jgi:hypothetical protein
MKNQIEVHVGIKDVKRSNLWLRAVWAKIRKMYGGCSWNFSPITFKESKTILFGRFSAPNEIKGTTEVYITYKNKGGIDKMLFKNPEYNLTDLLKELKLLLSTFDTDCKESEISTFVAMNHPIAEYEGNKIHIRPINEYQTNIAIKIKGFDKEDCQFIAKKKLDKIINLIAITTWYHVKFTQIDESTKKKNVKTDKNRFSDDIQFSMSDDHLVKGDIYYLPEILIWLFDLVLINDEYQFDVENLLNASNLFHSALKIESLRGEFSYSNTAQYELLITHYMSSLEVLSLDEEKAKKCEECGQNIFSISKRVKNLLTEVFNGEEFHIKRLHGLYNDRSKFLHVGKYLSNQAYVNISIPQLKKSGDLIEYQFQYDNGSIKYYVGQCFEYHLKKIKNSREQSA